MTNRQPKGTPKGGEFAEGRKPEGADLSATSLKELNAASMTASNIRVFMQNAEVKFVRTMGQGIDISQAMRRVVKEHGKLAKFYTNGGHTEVAQAHLDARDAAQAALEARLATSTPDVTEDQMNDKMEKMYVAFDASETAAEKSEELFESMKGGS